MPMKIYAENDTKRTFLYMMRISGSSGMSTQTRTYHKFATRAPRPYRSFDQRRIKALYVGALPHECLSVSLDSILMTHDLDGDTRHMA